MDEKKSQWYFEEHGSAKGPLSTYELVKRVRDGQLTQLDLVFKEGDGKWSPIETYPELSEQLKNVSTTYSQGSDWIVLKAIEVDGKEKYEQIGPFHLDQVLQLIDKGKIRFSDYVWKDGFENWVPLGKVDALTKPLPSSLKVDHSLYDQPRFEELNPIPVEEPKSVKKYKPIKDIFNTEEPPPEAKGSDLALPNWFKPRQKIKEEIIENKAVHAQEVTAPSIPLPSPTIQARWSKVASLGIVFILLAGGGLFLWNGKQAYRLYSSQKQSIHIQPITIVKSKKIEAITQAPLVTAPPPPPVVVASSAPAPTPTKIIQKLEKIEVKPVDSEKNKEFDFQKMSSKEKSYFHNRERLFIFYSAQKGLKLILELEKIIQKKPKKIQILKSSLISWDDQLKSTIGQISHEMAEPLIYIDIFQKLKQTYGRLNEVSKDITTQLLNSRGPSRDTTLAYLNSEFKKIINKAKSLD